MNFMSVGTKSELRVRGKKKNATLQEAPFLWFLCAEVHVNSYTHEVINFKKIYYTLPSPNLMF